MKRRGIVLGLICVLLMSGCTKNMTGNPVGGNVSDTSEVPSATVTDLGVSNSIEKPLAETEEQIVEGAYVNSFSCGYLSGDLVPDQYTMYLVTNEEELAYAECYLGMQIPLNVDDFSGFNTGLAEEFQKMKEAYPISDYNYLLYYSEYSQGGHYHHSDSVVFNEDRIYFHYDEVRSPEGEVGTDVMEGDFDMAAVPKAFFEGKNFKNTKRYGILLTEEGTADNEVEEGWCAKFEYGNPDFVNETFVYFTEDGYKCVNAHNTYILGTSKWERWMDYYELVSTKEEVLEAAKKHGSNGNLFYQGDDKMYEPEDFLDKVDVSEMQEPLFSPFGACDETYTGKKFTEEEFNAFLKLKYDDEVAQKEVLSKKGIKFGK
ncbi:MAG: hypothetical protein IJJ74_09610 [Eubacterium sp.]|nr:hypothetical protein [Eubacterium sp.]